MHLALIKYTVLRLAIFVGSLMLLWLVGVRESISLLLLSALISLALSYLLLAKQRQELAQAIATRTQERLAAGEALGQADAAAEDAALDAKPSPRD